MATSYLTKTFSSAGSTTTGTIAFWTRKAKKRFSTNNLSFSRRFYK